EVDRETGAVEILRYVVAEDCGVIINPAIVEGQVVGGVAQGFGAAVMEEVAYGADGELRSGTFLDYMIPSIGESPEVKIVHLVTPSTVHELGTKGAGEGGTIGATAAFANAIADACSLADVILPLPLGLGEHEMRWITEKARPALVIDSAMADELATASAAGLPTPATAAADPGRIVEIALTSGTTGMPKLASLSARLKQVTFES